MLSGRSGRVDGDNMTMRQAQLVPSILAVFIIAGGIAAAAELTERDVSVALAKAEPSHPIDFSHRDLSYLDLSDLDFKRANLSGANLYGADLSRTNLTGVNLAGAKLDHTVIINTNFAGADLSNASLFDAVAFSTFEVKPSEAPNFAGANLSGALVAARLSRSNMRGANLANIRMGMPTNHVLNVMRNALSGCDLSSATLVGADLRGIDLAFANLAGADLSHADLAHADLTQANLSGADITGVDLTETDLDETVFTDTVGLATVIGLDRARHRERLVR
jgi:uncharacterized protein YjbI with pentapeptide repeats